MEDQPADSGDLTADADTASVPQGKAARSRHRLPRQKARQDGDGDLEPTVAEDVTEAPEPSVDVEPEPSVDVEPAADPEVAADREVAPAPESEPETEPEPEPRTGAETQAPQAVSEAPLNRKRRPWRRGTASVPPAVEDDADDAVITDGETAEGELVADGPEPVLVPHRPAGRLAKAVAVAAGVLFVVAGAFAGAAVQPYLADRAAVQTKFAIAETAANAITTLWTYTPDDMDQLPDRSAKYLGGDFAADYRRYIDAIAAPNKQAQVSNNTQVLGAAVESLTPEQATAIVYTNSVATSPVTKGIPSLRYLSYRLTMKRDESRWLITQMVAVTKLDLTPRL